VQVTHGALHFTIRLDPMLHLPELLSGSWMVAAPEHGMTRTTLCLLFCSHPLDRAAADPAYAHEASAVGSLGVPYALLHIDPLIERGNAATATRAGARAGGCPLQRLDAVTRSPSRVTRSSPRARQRASDQPQGLPTYALAARVLRSHRALDGAFSLALRKRAHDGSTARAGRFLWSPAARPEGLRKVQEAPLV
jgi:hypothetical protein